MNPYRIPYGDPDAAADEFWGGEEREDAQERADRLADRCEDDE